MLTRLDISGIHMTVDENLHKYIERKIGKLDRYIPRHHRQSVHAEVKLKEARANGRKECLCEVTMHLPGESIVVNEGTVNMYAAVDIVQSKLKSQIVKFRERHSDGHHQRHLFSRLRRQTEIESSI